MRAPQQLDGDGADRIGRAISSAVLAALALLFIYGYLGPYFPR